MRVLLTGGTGSVGKPVCDELVRRGHEVTVVGRRENMDVGDAQYRSVDITDWEDVLQALEGFERVVHLAAIPNPHDDNDVPLFDINVRGTFHIFQACARHGITKVALASSINYLGSRFGIKKLPLHYFPLDEEHPNFVTDPYSFSKQLNESTAQYAWDRYGISSVSIRIPAVVRASERRIGWLRKAHEEGHYKGYAPDFWCLCDARDAANAFCDGIEAEYEGAHPIFVNDRVNAVGVPSRELAAQFFPEVTEWREPMQGCEALITCDKAKRLIGWEPQYSWEGVAAGGPVP